MEDESSAMGMRWNKIREENMRKKGFLKRAMAGVLSAAMIMTSLSSGSLMVYAEESADIVVNEDVTIEEEAINEESEVCDHSNVQTDPELAASCTEDGHTEGKICLDCGEVLEEMQTIKALGHEPCTDEAVAASCTSTGLTEGSHCSVCNAVLVAQEVIPALGDGHSYVTDEAVAPTPTESGLTEGMHCSVCGEVLVEQELIPATGLNHNYIVLEEEALDYLPIKEGEALTFTNFAKANAGIELSYQWYYAGYYDMDYNAHTMWTDEDKSIEETLEKMEGETGKSLTIEFDTIDWRKRFYECVITDEYGNSITQDFAAYPVTGLTYDEDALHTYKAASGASCTLKSTATNDKNTGLSYQWYTADGRDQYDQWINSQAISGAADSTYTVTTDHAQIYYCKVTDKYFNEIDEAFQVYVDSGLAYDEKVTHSYTVAPQENWIQLSSTAYVTDHSDLTYQWYACGYYDADHNWVEEAAIEGEEDYTINVYVDRERSFFCRATDVYGNYVDEYYEISFDESTVCDTYGHKEETVAGKEASCEEAGYTESIICSRCGKVLTEAEEIPALGHKLVPEWTEDEEYVAVLTLSCENCDYSKTYDPADNYVEMVSTAATCVNPGKKVTTVINHGYKTSFTKTTPATGIHQYYNIDGEKILCPGCGSAMPDETSVQVGDTTLSNVRITDLITADNTVNVNVKAADYTAMTKVADYISVDSDQVMSSSEDKLSSAEVLQKVITDNSDEDIDVSQILRDASSIDMTRTISMQVDILRYDKTDENKTIKMDITPIVTTTVVANHSDNSTNTFTVTEEIHDLQEDGAITVTIPLPAGFAKAGETIKIVLTHDGKEYPFYANVKLSASNKLYAEFDNNVGFSDVSLYTFASWDYAWAEDGSSCTLYAVLSDGEKREISSDELEDIQITSRVINKVSCTASGDIEYTYTASYKGSEYPTDVSIQATKKIHVTASGHKMVTDAAVAASCTKTGLTEGSHCSVCDNDAVGVAQKVIPATGHKAGKWTTTKAATNLAAGKEVQRCTVCKAVIRTRTIPRISEVTLYKGVNKSYTLTAGKWTLKKTGAASLKGNKLTIRKTGTIKVTEKKTKKTVTIKVKKPVLRLKKTKVTLKAGATYRIKVSATPVAKISYKSAASGIARVSSTGLITAVKKGKTRITVKANGVKKNITVTVK